MEVSEVSDEIYFLHDEGLEKLEEEIDSMSLESLYLEKITEGLDEAEIDF
jgi:ABC-2 type transport system ATP-binding protein